MASTHYKPIPYGVVPTSSIGPFPFLVKFTADTAIGARISSIDDIRFTTPGGTYLDWRSINLVYDGVGETLAGWAMVKVSAIDSGASAGDELIRVLYGGTPSASGARSTTLSFTGLQGAWDMESASPSDWSGNGYNGTGTSMSTTTGKIGTAGSFSGSGYVTVGDCGDTTTDVSLSAWVYLDAVSGFQGIITKRAAGGINNWALRAGDDDVQFYYVYSGAYQIWRAANILSSVEWQHVAVTYNGASDPIVYLNGSSQSGIWMTGGQHAMTADNANAVIGAYSAGSEPLSGKIDDARVYTSIQSAAEIGYQVSQTDSPGTPGTEQAIGGGTTTYNASVLSLAAALQGTPVEKNRTIQVVYA